MKISQNFVAFSEYMNFKRFAEDGFEVLACLRPKLMEQQKNMPNTRILTGNFSKVSQVWVNLRGNCSTRYIEFLTAILHHGLRNDLFFFNSILLCPIVVWTFIFSFLFELLFPFSLWTFISLFAFFYVYSIAVTFWISLLLLLEEVPRVSSNLALWSTSEFYQ